MRDRVSDRKFLLQKKVENRIENALGAKFRSGYAMVCYGGAGNVSYRNAWILSRVQVRPWQILATATSLPSQRCTVNGYPCLGIRTNALSVDSAALHRTRSCAN
jgi:hypothetical protein